MKLGNGASPEVFTAFSEEVEIDGLEIRYERKESTVYGDSSAAFKSGGIGTAEPIQVRCNLIRANIFTLKTKLDAQVPANWKYIYPSPLSLVCTFSGFPMGLKMGTATADGLLTVSFTISPTGGIIFS